MFIAHLLRVCNLCYYVQVPQKFRYPFFTEMLWYVLERYVHVLLGRTHLALPPSEHSKLIIALKEDEGDNNNTVRGLVAKPDINY